MNSGDKLDDKSGPAKSSIAYPSIKPITFPRRRAGIPAIREESMKVILLGLALTMSSAIFAIDFNSLEAKNLQLSLSQNEGQLSASNLGFANDDFRILLEQQDMELSKDQEGIHLRRNDGNILIKADDDGMIKSIEHLNIDNLDLIVNKGKNLQATISGLAVNLGKGIQNLQAASVKCQKRYDQQVTDSILAPCFDLGQILIPIIKIDDLSRKTVADSFVVPEEMRVDNSAKGLGPEELKDIKLHIINNAFNLSLKTKFIFKLTLKAMGSVHYDEEAGVITMILNSAKVGWFSVKGTVLKQLKKAGLDNVKVDGDVITITL